MGQIIPEPRLPDARITAIRMIVERSTDGASPSIETSSASFLPTDKRYRIGAG
jgi:hypothetical protein